MVILVAVSDFDRVYSVICTTNVERLQDLVCAYKDDISDENKCSQEQQFHTSAQHQGKYYKNHYRSCFMPYYINLFFLKGNEFIL